MLKFPEIEAKKVAEALREMSSAIATLKEIQSEMLSYNRKACHYVRISSEKIEKFKAKAIERQDEMF